MESFYNFFYFQNLDISKKTTRQIFIIKANRANRPN